MSKRRKSNQAIQQEFIDSSKPSLFRQDSSDEAPYNENQSRGASNHSSRIIFPATSDDTDDSQDTEIIETATISQDMAIHSVDARDTRMHDPGHDVEENANQTDRASI